MRSEKEMFDLIISIAKEDKRIRGVYMAGSRVNTNVEKDIFQDYDIVYVVSETNSFRKDKKWINLFGEILYMQYPDDGIWISPNIEDNYGWLMQFSDGNRLDLHVCTVKYLPESLNNDKMYKILLDKDNCLPVKDKASDEEYWVQKFSEDHFLCTCNEFCWCMNNVAKGLWRGEIPYVLDMINFNIRPMLTRLIEYKIGLETDFSVSIGKSAKYMSKWLSKEIYEKYLCTYTVAKEVEIWTSVFLMYDLFNEIALEISKKTGFIYNITETKNSRGYLEHIQRLPKDAKKIY